MNRAEVRDLMARLSRDAELIAAHFELSYRSIEPERANVKRRYGVCYSDGSIRIRLRHATVSFLRQARENSVRKASSER